MYQQEKTFQDPRFFEKLSWNAFGWADLMLFNPNKHHIKTYRAPHALHAESFEDFGKEFQVTRVSTLRRCSGSSFVGHSLAVAPEAHWAILGSSIWVQVQLTTQPRLPDPMSA